MSLAVPTLASAQDTRRVDISYEITYLGMSGFRIDVTAYFNGPTYDIESKTFKEGLLRAFTMNYEGRNRAKGTFTAQGAQPTGGSLSISVDGKSRTWLAEYGGNRGLKETHSPEWKPAPQQAIPESDRLGSLDPLSAAVSVSMAGDAGCDQTLPTNDGKRRIDVLLRKIRTEPAAGSGIPNAQRDVLVCDIYTKRVSGEFYNAPNEEEAKRERPVRLWLAHLDQSQVRYPGKLEIDTGFGTVYGKILRFTIR